MSTNPNPNNQKSNRKSSKTSNKSQASVNSSFKQLLNTPKSVQIQQAARHIANPFQLKVGFLFPDGTQVESICKVPSLEGDPQAPLRYFVTFRKADGSHAIEYVNKDLSYVQQFGYLYQLYQLSCGYEQSQKIEIPKVSAQPANPNPPI